MLLNLIERIPKTFDNILNLSMGVKIVAFFSMFVLPLYNHMGMIVVLLMIDLLTSIWAQYKAKKKRCKGMNANSLAEERFNCFVILYRTIKPARILESVEKIFGYSITLIVVFIMDYYLIRKGLDETGMFSNLSLSNAVFLLIIAAEAWSINRNLGTITGNRIFTAINKMISKKTGYEENVQ